MPIVLSNPVTPPAPQYDKVHLDFLNVSLERTAYAKTTIQARLTPYAQDPVTGVKTFAIESAYVDIPDAEALAIQLAGQSDMRGVQAAGYIKEIVALLVSLQTNWGSSTVS